MNSIEDLIRTAGLVLREAPTHADRDAVRRMVSESGFFTEAEADVAVELIEERLAKGSASGYDFIFVEADGSVVGYACYGEIPCTVGSYDLYWVAVDKSHQRRGIGRLLVELVEARLRERGARKVYIETSSKPLYDPTRAFYARCGYREVAAFPDFYAPGDGKVVYEKTL